RISVLQATAAGPCSTAPPRHIETDDNGQGHLDTGHTADGEDVVVIERSRPHSNHHMVFSRHGVGEVRHILELFETALLFQQYGFHCFIGSAYDSIAASMAYDPWATSWRFSVGKG